MASKAGPDEEDRTEPGDTSTNPAGASSPKPVESENGTPPPQPGSPDA